jgi:hypothetical protein
MRYVFYNYLCDQEIPIAIESQSSLPCSQNPAFQSYPEILESNPPFNTLF